MKSRGHPNDCGCEIHKAAPARLPTLKELWEAQFRQHIVGMLTLDGQGWERAKAQRAAQDELDALPEDEKVGDPVECANECMSYWDCEPDFAPSGEAKP